jgi:hypothetical protein
MFFILRIIGCSYRFIGKSVIFLLKNSSTELHYKIYDIIINCFNIVGGAFKNTNSLEHAFLNIHLPFLNTI